MVYSGYTIETAKRELTLYQIVALANQWEEKPPMPLIFTTLAQQFLKTEEGNRKKEQAPVGKLNPTQAARLKQYVNKWQK